MEARGSRRLSARTTGEVVREVDEALKLSAKTLTSLSLGETFSFLNGHNNARALTVGASSAGPETRGQCLPLRFVLRR